MSHTFLQKYRKELIASLALFSLALGLRLLYQRESEVKIPLRADAGKYTRAAYNLRQFGLYSLDPPREDGKAPESRTDLSPAYPLFLSLFVDDDLLEPSPGFVARILGIQAVMGALTTIAVFIMARMCLGYSWAILAGVLTSVSPHLIALDGYVLTESLFTLLLMLGGLFLTVSLRSDRAWLTFISTLFVALSAQVRAVTYLLPLFLAPAILLFAPTPRWAKRTSWIRHLASVLAACLLVIGFHREFVKLTVTHEPGVFQLFAGTTAVQERRESPSEYVMLHRPEVYLQRALHPPNFFMDGKSHIIVVNRDEMWKEATSLKFAERPLAYLQWNLVGKFHIMWHWDNAYNGDVYLYPMIRKGFQDNRILSLIHGVARVIHWPLYWLALAAPIVFTVGWRRNTLTPASKLLVIPTLMFIYFIGMIWLVSWLPRYSIPVRPVSYILASFCLSSAVGSMTRKGLRTSPEKRRA